MEPITLTVAAVIGLGVLSWAVNLGRNWSFTKDGPVFRASRWTKGNRVCLIFGDVIIETTGGSQPIRCHGHFRGDAEQIRRQITEAQAVTRARS